MTISFELLETFTGQRTHSLPDPENEGQTIDTTEECRDIQVRFTCSNTAITHERSVNVCFDIEGNYDEEATLIRIQEVANGIDAKIHAGVISSTAA